MYLIDPEGMARLDHETIETYGLPGVVLMEHAALRVVEFLSHYLTGLAGKKVIIFAGKGNNGGDGLAIARLLDKAGAHVTTFLLCRPDELQGDALLNYNILHAFGGKTHLLTEEKDLQKVDIALMRTEIIIDALYGTGFKGAIGGVAAKVINLMNNSGLPIIAVDLPSGLESGTGRVNGPCVRAAATVTFGLAKLGLVLEPGASYVGQLWVGDISLPAALIEQLDGAARLISAAGCAARLPQRKSTGHKGSYGHVIAVGGSEGMAGAISLAAHGALRSGAGLVTAAVPRSLHSIMEIKTTEVMTKPLPETENMTISQEALEPLLALAHRANVLLLGPGMSQHQGTASLIKKLLPQVNKPLVLDADALNILSHEEPRQLLSSLKAPVVVTPHPGEMARLLGISVKEVQQNRVATALQAAKDWRAVVVLKGAKTLIASPDGRLFVNPTGNAGMATGGSGDVLAGVVAGLLAQGMELLDAALAAVYAHGWAGDQAGRRHGLMGLTAGDLLAELPRVFWALETAAYPVTDQINERLIRIA